MCYMEQLSSKIPDNTVGENEKNASGMIGMQDLDSASNLNPVNTDANQPEVSTESNDVIDISKGNICRHFI